MDFVSVFDQRHHNLNIVSYEENEAVAKKSRTCIVAVTRLEGLHYLSRDCTNGVLRKR